MLPVAKVIKSFGTDGGLLCSSDVDLESLDFKEPVFIEFDGLQVPFFILDITPKGGKTVIHLNDVKNLADAEEMTGRTLWADVELEEEPGADFTGWSVSDNGRMIGTCTGIEPIPANPCLNVELSDGRDILIPLHEDFIVEVNEDSRTLSLKLPEGLY